MQYLVGKSWRWVGSMHLMSRVEFGDLSKLPFSLEQLSQLKDGLTTIPAYNVCFGLVTNRVGIFSLRCRHSLHEKAVAREVAFAAQRTGHSLSNP